MADVGDPHRLARRGDPAGHALAERHPRAADLVAVESVRRGQGQVGAVAVEQVERGDVARSTHRASRRRSSRAARPTSGRSSRARPRDGGTAAGRAGPPPPAGCPPGRPGSRWSMPWPSRYKPRHEGVETGLRSGCVRLRGRCRSTVRAGSTPGSRADSMRPGRRRVGPGLRLMGYPSTCGWAPCASGSIWCRWLGHRGRIRTSDGRLRGSGRAPRRERGPPRSARPAASTEPSHPPGARPTSLPIGAGQVIGARG